LGSRDGTRRVGHKKSLLGGNLVLRDGYVGPAAAGSTRGGENGLFKRFMGSRVGFRCTFSVRG
jgi:hypothetical protein